jgi:hypothetical protein
MPSSLPSGLLRPEVWVGFFLLEILGIVALGFACRKVSQWEKLVLEKRREWLERLNEAGPLLREFDDFLRIQAPLLSGISVTRWLLGSRWHWLDPVLRQFLDRLKR